MLVKSALIAHSIAGALAAATGPVTTGTAVTRATPAVSERLIEVGDATWYHRQHSPNITASGEHFDPSAMTAAHRSIPLGTMVRVTDEATGRSVVVRVNDREPPHGRRCIDLSEGAAFALGIHHEGVAHVSITEVGTPDGALPVEVAEAPDAAATPARRRHAGAHRRR